MITTEMVEILGRMEKLPLTERLWLLERLAASVRRGVSGEATGQDLAAMAADPDVQREMRRIEEDFQAVPEQPVGQPS